MTTAYPLAWPEGWPRTPDSRRKDSRRDFGRVRLSASGTKTTSPWLFSEARDALFREIERIGGKDAILSSNYMLRSDGLPSANRGKPEDEGVAVYFNLKGKPMVIACDLHIGAPENMRSIALSLEAMRALERHGGGLMMEKAFAGFTALPAPKRPHEVLGIDPNASPADVQAAWRRRIAGAHPDQGGSQTEAAEINAARDAILKREDA